MKKFVSGILLIILMITLAGCGGISIPTEDGGKMKIGKDGLSFEGTDGSKGKITTDKDGSVVFETDDGNELRMGEDLDLPDGYPKDVLPLYKEDSILSTAVSEGSYHILYRSKASLKDSTEYYKKLVEGAENNTISASDTGAMIFAKIDGRECAIIINEDSESKNKSNISLTVGSK
jgi:hypothetical protein